MSLRSRRILLTLVVLSACLVFTIPQAGNSAQHGRVTEMRLEASPNDWHGGCPVTINFNGSISVDGPNTVTYGITRSGWIRRRTTNAPLHGRRNETGSLHLEAWDARHEL